MTSATLAVIALGWLIFQIMYGTSHAASILYVYDPDQGILTPLRAQTSSRPSVAFDDLSGASESVMPQGNVKGGGYSSGRANEEYLVDARRVQIPQQQQQQQQQAPQQQLSYQGLQPSYAGQSGTGNGWLSAGKAQNWNPWQTDSGLGSGVILLIPSSSQRGNAVADGFDVDPTATSISTSTSTMAPTTAATIINLVPVSPPQTMIQALAPASSPVAANPAMPQPMGAGPGGPWDYSSMNMMNDPSMSAGFQYNPMQQGQQQQMPSQFAGMQ